MRQTGYLPALPLKFCLWDRVRELVIIPYFMKIGRGSQNCADERRGGGGVENRHIPLTWPMIYTTACTTIQAVTEPIIKNRSVVTQKTEAWVTQSELPKRPSGKADAVRCLLWRWNGQRILTQNCVFFSSSNIETDAVSKWNCFFIDFFLVMFAWRK